MKDKKNMKWIPVLFYIASACDFFVACMNLFCDGSGSMTLIYMSLGSLNIALGEACEQRKQTKNTKKNKQWRA